LLSPPDRSTIKPLATSLDEFHPDSRHARAADGGPLTLRDASDSIHVALFEREVKPCRSTVALRASAEQYRQWKEHLRSLLPGQFTEEDHEASISLYFSDPDGNPFEITTYEVTALRASSAA